MTFFHEIQKTESEIEDKKRAYLQRFGWSMTCNTPGSYWLWRRDFAKEDAERHARWKQRGPGPLGWPSEPQPYGVVTASQDLAVGMTVRCLDDQIEIATPVNDED